MARVQPIRNPKTIEEIKDAFKVMNKNEFIATRNKFMFVFGINTGLRISDILPLKVEDVTKVSQLKEKKTKKFRRLIISPFLQQEIQKYVLQQGLSETDFLFQSRKGSNNPISTTQAYRTLKQVSEFVGIEEIGTHSLRKTFGWFYYEKTHDVATLMEIFNHGSQQETLKYIGKNDEIIEKSLSSFSIGL